MPCPLKPNNLAGKHSNKAINLNDCLHFKLFTDHGMQLGLTV